MARNKCQKEGRISSSGKPPGKRPARNCEARRGRNSLGNRQSAGTDWEQQERQTEQQEDQELGGGRGQGQQEAKVLKILYTNAQSIVSKLNEMSAFVGDMKPDFILLTESWCNPSINDTDLTIPGYQLEQELRKDRTDTANGIVGGLLVYSRSGQTILPLNTEDSPNSKQRT